MLRGTMVAVVLVLFAGCSAVKHAPEDHAPEAWRDWCGPAHALRGRFEATMEAEGRMFFATGFLALDPERAVVDAVILTPLGIKLATLRVTSREVLQLQQLSPLPVRLTDQIGLALRRVLVLAWPCLSTGPADGEAPGRASAQGVQLEFGPDANRVSSRSGTAMWTALAQRPNAGSGDGAPREIVIRDEASGFTLSLVIREENDAH